MPAEPGPGIYFHQQIRDPDSGEHAAGRVDQRLRLDRHDRLQWRDLQTGGSDRNARKLAVGGELFDLGEALGEEFEPGVQVGRVPVGCHDRQLLRTFQGGVVPRFEEVFVEVTKLSRAAYPHVSGAKRIAELCQDTEFVKPPIDPLVGEDQRFPAGPDEGSRCSVWNLPDTGRIQLPENLDSCEQIDCCRCGVQVKDRKELGRVAAHGGELGADQCERIRGRGLGEFLRRCRALGQCVPPDHLLDDRERFLSGLSSFQQRLA